MATVSPSSLHFSSNQFPSPRALFFHKPNDPKPFTFTFTFTTRATDSDTPTESDSENSQAEPDDPFESRLSQVRIRYRSGTGKKAEVRKSKKGAATTKSGSSSVYLPPVPLKEPVSGGLKVEFGFSPYSEKINGRIAIIGLSALLAVELATGKGVINYHTPAIVLIQVYFVAAVTALFVKYEKESVSIWPEPKK